MLSQMFPSIRISFRGTPNEDLDKAFHVKRACGQSMASVPSKHNSERDVAKLKSTITPSDRYELQKFEHKYRACVAAADNCGTIAQIDELYHDDVVHMMDGVPMNKTALKQLYIEMLKRGTKRTIEKFHVIDGSHVETVIHTRNVQMEFYGRSLITLNDGKIIRVEKIESAIPIPIVEKIQLAKAA